ncbi:MAG: DUF892 family protein, partial [Flavobacteriales bacterium]|nr:DUF892 family protein [Flavobacteriales bacterium]
MRDRWGANTASGASDRGVGATAQQNHFVGGPLVQHACRWWNRNGRIRLGIGKHAGTNHENELTMAKKNESKGLLKLLEDQVADIYYAEKKLLPALKKMAASAKDKALSAAFTAHHEETRE